MVFLDDVHAADDATLDAIAYLGRRLTGRSLLLVLGWRTERVPPGIVCVGSPSTWRATG